MSTPEQAGPPTQVPVPPQEQPDAGAGTGTPVEPAPVAALTLPPTQVTAPSADTSGGVIAVSQAPGENAGVASADSAPALPDLQNQICPNCHVGVLYVKRYDPVGLHEQGQDIFTYNTPQALPAGHSSGGAYDVQCANCQWSHSFPLNPGERFGQPR